MLSGVPFNIQDHSRFKIRILAGHEFVFWKAEFIRETVVELGELTGDVVMFMFVTTDSAPQG